MKKFDFETLADAQDLDLGTDYNPDIVVMSGAQLHLKTAPCIIEALQQGRHQDFMDGHPPIVRLT